MCNCPYNCYENSRNALEMRLFEVLWKIISFKDMFKWFWSNLQNSNLKTTTFRPHFSYLKMRRFRIWNRLTFHTWKRYIFFVFENCKIFVFISDLFLLFENRTFSYLKKGHFSYFKETHFRIWKKTHFSYLRMTQFSFFENAYFKILRFQIWGDSNMENSTCQVQR